MKNKIITAQWLFRLHVPANTAAKSIHDSAVRVHIRGFPMQFRPFPFDISPFFSFFAPSKQYSETYEHENN